MRRSAWIAVVVLACVVVSTAGEAGARPAPEPAAQAALKKCKKGLNSKRCRCPKGQKLTRKGRKYRCVKKATTKTPTTPAPLPPTPAPPAKPDPRVTFTDSLKGSKLTDEAYDRAGTSSH